MLMGCHLLYFIQDDKWLKLISVTDVIMDSEYSNKTKLCEITPFIWK